jgi:hypothetical protein
MKLLFKKMVWNWTFMPSFYISLYNKRKNFDIRLIKTCAVDLGEDRMIRKLKKDDHESVIALIDHKPAENLFIIGDIEAFGYDSNFQEIWGQFQNEKFLPTLGCGQ